MSFIQDSLGIFNTSILQELLRANSRPLRKHTLEMRRTQRHLPSNLIQSRLPFKILPYIPDCLRNACIVKRFLLIHNRGLPFNSKSSNHFLAGSPPPYPTREWLLPMTRWHGAKIEIAFAPLAAATARTAFGKSSCFASSPYDTVEPYGISNNLYHTLF